MKEITSIIDFFIRMNGQKNVIWLMGKTIRIISAIIIIQTYVISRYGNGVQLPVLQAWGYFLIKFTNVRWVGGSLVSWVVYDMVISKLIKKLLAFLDKTSSLVSYKIMLTIDDLFATAVSMYVLAYAITYKFDTFGVSVNCGRNSACISAAYIVGVFLIKCFVDNSFQWDLIRQPYTCFFDSKGERIPENAMLIYNGELHKLIRDDREFYLRSSKGEKILLRDAVKDRTGEIRVYDGILSQLNYDEKK